MNAVEVCNTALAYIGQGAGSPVESVTGGDFSPAGTACALFYLPTLSQLSAAYAWPFLRQSTLLAATALEVPGWSYAYAYPAACARLVAVGPDDWDPWRNPTAQSPTPHRLGRDPGTGATLVLCDESPAWAHYVARLTAADELADDSFGEALAWALAAKLALTLKASPDIARFAREQALLSKSNAIAAAMRQTAQGAEADSRDIQARLDTQTRALTGYDPYA